ncbi:MAG: LptF/LptG family permease [Armatimonadetes bacterium]|nr:LptF/LptG family permease [Armatimonadota bacterium]
MKLLDKYIFHETGGSFCFGIGIFTALMLAGDLLRRAIQMIVEKGAPGYLVFELLVLRLPSIIVLTIPMATLLAMLLSFSRLSTQLEINAMRAGGMSFLRIMIPALSLGLMASLVTILLNEQVAPPANLASDKILEAIGEKSLEQAPRGILLRDPQQGDLKRIIFAQSYDNETRTFVRPDVMAYAQGKPSAVISADSAKWTGTRWEFTNGYMQIIGQPKVRPSIDWRDTFYWDLGKSPDEVQREIRELQPANMTIQEMREYIRDLKQRPGMDRALRYALVEVNNKVALPFSCLAFALVGAPLGLQPQRSSSSIGVGFSIVCIFVYYVIWYYSSLLGQGGQLPPLLASWSGNIVTAIVGALLVYKASK